MKNIIKNKNIITKVIIIICFAFIIFNLNECHMNLDDEVYSKVFHNFETFKIWVNEFYNTWSGRIVTSALSNIFLRMPLIIFKICNTAVYILGIIAIFKIVKIFKKTEYINENVLLTSIFTVSLLISYDVLFQGMIWVTGAFNYLWPTAFLCVAFIPFVKAINQIEEKKINFIIYIVADFIACFAEQTALVLLCFGCIVIIYKMIKKQKISKMLWIHFILIAILSGIELLAPGNFVRSNASTLRRYPSFGMLSIGDKLLQGIIVLANQMLGKDIFLMLILTFFIAKNNPKKYFFAIPFLYFFCSFIGARLGIGEGILYNISLYGKEYIYGIKIYIPILMFVINLILIANSILFSYEDMNKGAFVAIIFLASIASALSVSFSPTIYVSGARIFFLTDFLILIVIHIMEKMESVTSIKYLNKATTDDKINIRR